jgi:20S proteasome subunit alpha 1
MATKEQVFNVFNDEGKLLQVEYGLEAVASGLPIVAVKSKDTIVCAAKKRVQDKLEDEGTTSFYRISSKCYAGMTGLSADIDYVVMRAKELASKKSFSFGFETTPDILCRALADKMQKLVQSIGERPPAFAAAVLGFDRSKPMIYHTDLSAICYPCYGVALGDQSSKMRKSLEDNYREDASHRDLVETAVRALLQSIGSSSEWSEVEVAYMKEDCLLVHLSSSEIDRILQEIAEK